MAGTKISLGGPGTFEAVEVDLWGSIYRTVPITRSVQAKSEKHLKKLEALEQAGGSADDIVKATAALIEARVAPVNGAGPVSTLILEKWNGDELSLPQLQKFGDDLADAEAPPT